jgi:hypothetical protein
MMFTLYLILVLMLFVEQIEARFFSVYDHECAVAAGADHASFSPMRDMSSFVHKKNKHTQL